MRYFAGYMLIGGGFDLLDTSKSPLIRAGENTDIAAGAHLSCHPWVADSSLFTLVCGNHHVIEGGTEAIHATEQTVFQV